MIKVQKIFVMAALVLIPSVSFAQKVNILTEKTASNREQYAAEYLQKKLNSLGFQTVVNGKKGEYRISLSQAKDTAGLKKEGFSWTRKGKKIQLQGMMARVSSMAVTKSLNTWLSMVLSMCR